MNSENEKALAAQASSEAKNDFLEENEDRILRLTGTIKKEHITRSDDEFIIGLTAVSSAIDSYREDKGNFWSYASVIIKNRLIDHYRSNQKYRNEILASDNVFDGTTDYEDPEFLLQEQVADHAQTVVDDSLKLEIQALNEELSSYDISFFDLASCSPKAQKTRSQCAEIIRAFFLPPPLVEFLEKKKRFPSAEINKRVKNAKKCVERYKKYLISSVLIIRGDYPNIAEYISWSCDSLLCRGKLNNCHQAESQSPSDEASGGPHSCTAEAAKAAVQPARNRRDDSD